MNSVNYGAQFEIESPPDLFPMFRQYRFVLDQYVSGNGSWTLRGFDRATGNERCRFSNMVAPNLYSNSGQPIPYSKFVQGNGHILLVQLGMWVYCFDLAEKKELWNKNLLGENQPQVQPGVNPNPPVQVMPNGAMIVRFTDGYTMTLGRSTIIEPSYCAASHSAMGWSVSSRSHVASSGRAKVSPNEPRFTATPGTSFSWKRVNRANQFPLNSSVRWTVLSSRTRPIRAVSWPTLARSSSSGVTCFVFRHRRRKARAAALRHGDWQGHVEEGV